MSTTVEQVSFPGILKDDPTQLQSVYTTVIQQDVHTKVANDELPCRLAPAPQLYQTKTDVDNLEVKRGGAQKRLLISSYTHSQTYSWFIYGNNHHALKNQIISHFYKASGN